MSKSEAKVGFSDRMGENRFIITGGPGFGKSAVLSVLAARGYDFRDEAARQIIKDNMTSNPAVLPWVDRVAFDRLQVVRMERDYLSADVTRPTFFDRGFPDLIGWRQFAGLGTSDIVDYVYRYPYERTAFFTHPWQEIYVENDQRPFSYDEAKEINEKLFDTYVELGYEPVFMPNSSPDVRANFIVENVELTGRAQLL